jgi:hypothetical protein
MISRIALFIASLAAALTLAVALAAGGFAPGSSQPVPASSTTIPVDPAAADDVTPPPVQVDTVYVAVPPKQQTITVNRVAAPSGGEGVEPGESVGGDD